MPDDYSADRKTTGTVAVGGSATGNIETGGDRDWFAVTLQAGRTYEFDLRYWYTFSTGDGLEDPYLYGIHDADGTLIAGTSDDDGGWLGYNSQVSFTPDEDGTYYVEAGAYGTGWGTYELSVRDVTPASAVVDDFSADTDTTGTLAVGAPATGEIEVEGDRDWFKVTLKAGKTYRFDMEGAPTGHGTLPDPYVWGIHDATGTYIAGTRGGIFSPGEDGTYYVEAGADSRKFGTYTLSVAEVTKDAGDDHAAGTGTTGTVAVGGSATGTIESDGDRDWFKVTLEAGRTYRFDLEGSYTEGGTLPDPVLYGIYDSKGAYVARTYNDNWAGPNSRVGFSPSEDGTYYVEARAKSGKFGTYTLSVADITNAYGDDHAAGTGTAGTVAVGGSVMGEIEVVGDRDWIAVTLEAGKTYQFDLDGSPFPPGNPFLSDPYLGGIHDADGKPIAGTAEDDDAPSWESRVRFTPAEDGTYFVEVSSGNGGTGPYELSVNEVPDDDYAEGTATTGRVAVGGSTTGEIESGGDEDWFAVTLEADKVYRIDLEGASTGRGTLVNPYLSTMRDATGGPTGGYADGGGRGDNARLAFKPSEDGTYYVVARASGIYERGTYTLSVSDITAEAADDYSDGTDTAGTVAVGGSATGEIEVYGDRDWFAVTLEAGKKYQFDLEKLLTYRNTLWDPYLHGIHDAGGALIAGTTNDDTPFTKDSRVTFTPSEDGTYYVAAGGYFDIGPYRLSVTEVTPRPTPVPPPPDPGPGGDYADDSSGTPGTVAVGGSVSGSIQTDSDEDWFAVTLEADKVYRIDLEGASTGQGTLTHPYLAGIFTRLSPLTHWVGGRDYRSGEGDNSRQFFSPLADGVHYVVADGYRGSMGTYTLSVTEVAAGAGMPTTVAVGGSVTGEVATAGDRDWFAVKLEADKKYRFDLEGINTGRGTLHDPYLYEIRDARGKTVGSDPWGDTDDHVGGEGLNARMDITAHFFTAREEGYYYVQAGGHESHFGTYTLSVTDITNGVPPLPPDDYSADTSTTGTVAVGGSVTGNIEPDDDTAIERDHDWFAVTLEAGRTYRFDLEGTPAGKGGLWDPELHGIHDAGGSLIHSTMDDDGGEGFNSRVAFSPDEDGTYYVAAGGNYKGTYTLSVTDVTPKPADDYAADTGTTGTVAVGGSATGELETADDRDWFTVTLEAGKTYQIDLEGFWTDGGTLSDPYLRGIHDAKGTLIAGTQSDGGGAGRNALVLFTPSESGTHYVAAGAKGPPPGTYRLSVSEVVASAPDDYSADTGTTGAVAVGGSATGEIDPAGDRDWFAVTLEAGKTYRLDLEGGSTGQGTLGDPYLRGIHDATGTLIDGTANDDGSAGYNSRVIFTPDKAGTYYVAAGAFGGGEGSYTLSVAEVEAGAGDRAGDDYSADASTTGTVAVGGSVHAGIGTASDRDWFAVTLEAGKTYQVEMEGFWTGGGTLYDPYLRGIYDADGSPIGATASDGGGAGRNALVLFTPDASGTYYVSAGAVGGLPGTYRLSVSEVVARAPDDYSANTGTSGAVAVGGSASGTIDPAGDIDWFKVTLEADKAYRFDLEGASTGRGTLPDPVLLGILDAAGTLIEGTADDEGGEGRNSRTTFTPGADGAYYVSAGGYGSSEGTYTLSVEEVVDGL